MREDAEQYRSFEQEIYDTMVSRLREAGRSTDVASSEAMLWPAFYRVMAQRSGLTTEEFMQRYPLPQVKGALPEGIQLKDTGVLNRTLAEARARRKIRDNRQTLLEFIADYGGINDPGGELRARDAERVKRPGKKTLKLARSNAAVRDILGGGDGKRYGVDDVALAAIERGFMADDPAVIEFKAAMADGRQVPDLSPALWEAIDRELRGEPQYSAQDAPDPTLERGKDLDQLEDYLSSLGVSLDDDDATIKAALERGEGRQYAQQASIRSALQALIEFAKSAVRNKSKKVVLGPVSPKLAEALNQRAGLDVAGYQHDVDADAIRHIFKQHGDEAREIARGQLPITDADIELIPQIIATADYLVTGAKNPRKQDVVGYIKTMADGSVLYLEEVRTGRETLSALSMRKYPAAKDPGSIAETLLSNARSDGGARISVAPFPKDANRLFQNARGLIQLPADGVASGESIIRLFETANLSTMLHESGHFFLAVLEDLALRGETNAVTDFAAVKTWWRSNAADVAKDATRANKAVAVTAA